MCVCVCVSPSTDTYAVHTRTHIPYKVGLSSLHMMTWLIVHARVAGCSIHGVQTTCGTDAAGNVHCPTSFPNPVSLGSVWNASMIHEMGSIIGRELRALWLDGETEASRWSGKPHAGLDCWSPNININRDPRCKFFFPIFFCFVFLLDSICLFVCVG